MENSEKRRERLKAMRSIAAAQAETSNNVETSAPPGLLAYPLLETPTTLLAQGESSAIARFDFYTDPSVTFSANRKSVVGNLAARSYFTFPSNNSSVPQLSSPHPGQRNLELTPSHAYQMQNSYSHANQMQSNHLPNQRMYRGQGPDHNAASYRSPRGFSGPFPMNQGAPPEMWTGPGGPASYFSSTLHGGLSCPYPIRQGNPGFGPVGSSPSPVSGYGGSPAISQTGQGNWHSSSGFGQSGGRGQGFRSRGFAPNEAQEPECFYDNSMVEDPWQHLEPVLWSGQ
ncbi:hypothetical protein NC652_013996 [Populus alba x Populus x berolinensis]|uniref:Hydroxyproline-rich glycoprotein family protein n=2 Tax=Populus TaxID=3689 RepID=A0A8X8A165_POPTO|nr:hypothetical protein POTOM_019455 [Populus tomentosa]KAJ6930333.1 hypothetical protein NC652_013996 [Populus alba x Populus x berolinensis]